MSDEMNLYLLRKSRQRRPFALELLHAVFAKESQASFDGLQNCLCGMCFGDGHQSYLMAMAPGAPAGLLDALFDCVQPVLEDGHDSYLIGQ